LLYRRKRYYDPEAGLFTQEDPIGIAGGLNLYGYAGGDPINYSDPFGLCPEEDRDADGNCPGGLSVEQWQEVEQAAKRMHEMSEATSDKAEYATFVLGAPGGAGAQDSRVWGGGSNGGIEGTPYYGNALPTRRWPGAVALVHSHPYGVTGSGGRQATLLRATGEDAANARYHHVPVFMVNQNGMRVVLPNGVLLRKTWPLGG
jgi:uncharacterized protein RhaS with RHS repeats